MALSSAAKWAIGIGIGVTAGAVILVLRGRRKRISKQGADAGDSAVAQMKAAGIEVPAGANNIVKNGIGLLNDGKIDSAHFEALYMQVEQLYLSKKAPLLDKIEGFFQKRQPDEYKPWKDLHGKKITDRAKVLWLPRVKKALDEMKAAPVVAVELPKAAPAPAAA